jgi:hypothetical protein
VWAMDTLGRRSLLLLTLPPMALTMLAAGLSFNLRRLLCILQSPAEDVGADHTVLPFLNYLFDHNNNLRALLFRGRFLRHKNQGGEAHDGVNVYVN